MFRLLANFSPTNTAGAALLFRHTPAALAAIMEGAWAAGQASAATTMAYRRSPLTPIPTPWLNPILNAARVAPGPTSWEHLIYAYMVENTRIYEIFRRVLHELLHGEKLGVPTDPGAHLWLRNTEELFYREQPSFTIGAITSYVRPDHAASRRNAYWRMFGLDLNHGTEAGQPHAYVKADAANSEFVSTFEELLRESWVAISNRNNGVGFNPTDQGKLQNLIETLQNMLTARRLGGNLAREEFVFVAMMSWFHLTVAFDSPIVVALQAQSTGPEQRLFKIAQRVGSPAHGLSKSYFDIAEPISELLIAIESSGVALVPLIATLGPGPLNAQQTLLSSIITHWSIITGREMKAGKVVSS